MTHIVFIALGTNLGNRSENLRLARKALAPEVRLVQMSSVYETPPWGVVDQPDFLNQVLRVETELEPLDLLVFLKALETRLGRRPGVRYGPRLIDLDILFFEDRIVDTPQLVVPHPRLEDRAFVLVPLAEIAPGLKHPVHGRTVRQMLDNLEPEDIHFYEEQENE